VAAALAFGAPLSARLPTLAAGLCPLLGARLCPLLAARLGAWLLVAARCGWPAADAAPLLAGSGWLAARCCSCPLPPPLGAAWPRKAATASAKLAALAASSYAGPSSREHARESEPTAAETFVGAREGCFDAARDAWRDGGVAPARDAVREGDAERGSACCDGACDGAREGARESAAALSPLTEVARSQRSAIDVARSHCSFGEAGRRMEVARSHMRGEAERTRPSTR
jgi:hypothetical protein